MKYAIAYHYIKVSFKLKSYGPEDRHTLHVNLHSKHNKTRKRALHALMPHSTVCNTTVSATKIRPIVPE